MLYIPQSRAKSFPKDQHKKTMSYKLPFFFKTGLVFRQQILIIKKITKT